MTNLPATYEGDTDTLNCLQSTVSCFDPNDKLALACFLIGEANLLYEFELKEDGVAFGEALESAFETGIELSTAEKIAFAIELLQDYQEEEREGRWEDEDEENDEYCDCPDCRSGPYDYPPHPGL